MGILTSTLAPLLSRALQEGPYPITAARVVEWLAGPATATGQRVSQQSALGLSAVWDAVDMVSRDVARTPTPLYQRTPGGRAKADTDRLYYLLNTAPNPFMTAFAWKQALQGHKMLWGNAFAQIERAENGEIIALWPLRPDRMERPLISAAGTLLYRYTLENGTPLAFTQDEVLHIRGYSNDGIWGMSPIAVHRETIALGMAYREFSSKFFNNNASPGGVLQKKDGHLSTEAAKRLRDSWDEAHKGMNNAWRTAVLEDGIEWRQIGMPLADAQFIEATKLNRIEVASIWHIPPHKVNEMDRATYSNVEEQDLDYEGAVLDGEFAMWEQQFNKDLLRPSQQGQFYFEFLRQALVRAKLIDRMAAYKNADFMTWNEKRQRENLNDLPGLDEVFVPVNNLLPMSMIGKVLPQSTSDQRT